MFVITLKMKHIYCPFIIKNGKNDSDSVIFFESFNSITLMLVPQGPFMFGHNFYSMAIFNPCPAE